MLNTSLNPWPSYSIEEIDAVSRVLSSGRVNYWTGNECREFEKEFATWLGVGHAIAVMNGTVALDLALIALNVGPGDEVIVTPRSFIASVSCVVNCGATPVFSDVDKNTGNISAEEISTKISNKTKAIICVHLAGLPCDMDSIMRLADAHGIKVIEDCAQAHGARYKGKLVGSFGHVSAWSFCQDKIITTGGEGGMVTTNQNTLWNTMWSFKDHGKSYSSVYEKKHPQGFRWLHDSFGTNWRMLEFQAVIGRLQLKKIEEWTRVRNENARRIISKLKIFPALINQHELFERLEQQNSRHAFYKLYFYVDGANLENGWNRDRIVEEINKDGVICFHGTCSEIYLEKAFEQYNFKSGFCKNAHFLGENSIMFLVHPSLSSYDVNLIITRASFVLSRASKFRSLES